MSQKGATSVAQKMKRRRGTTLKGVQILNKINTIKHQEKKRAKKGIVYT